ncbi:hypothetical protein [Bacillus sp. 3255]|uniref:hypothetical protein n=1 Tax=Bacillus sp. 3255 TaxID=2817904 RepID=UPI002861027F|nr:hypothetical protein [Bacillus sp. 3255]MDR6881958.1 hypothetical protein [Bacillus sp. 3255]
MPRERTRRRAAGCGYGAAAQLLAQAGGAHGGGRSGAKRAFPGGKPPLPLLTETADAIRGVSAAAPF